MKLIAIDMDGTLLTKALDITQANALGIQQAQRQGIAVVIATGRPYAWARAKLAAAGLICPIIGSNGAELYGQDGSKLVTIPLGDAVFAEIRALLEQERLYYEVYTNIGVFTDNPEGAIALRMTAIRETETHLPEEAVRAIAEQRFERSTIIPVQSLEEVLAGVEIYKLLTCSYDSSRLQHCQAALERKPQLAISSSAGNNLEITNAAAQKGLALQRMAAHLNIPLNDTAAIGDNHNDVQMLQMAGMAIAMDNAEEGVKRVCRYTTLSNEESGVAHAIETYCLTGAN